MTAVEAAAIVPTAVAGGRRGCARDECCDGLPGHHAVHVQALDLALDRVVGIPDEAVLQRR